MKSRQVQTLPKYLQRPKAIHLRNISMVKRTAKTRLTILRMNFNSSLSWRLISSKQRDRLQIWDIEVSHLHYLVIHHSQESRWGVKRDLEAKMRRRMVHSKKGLSTMSWTIERKKSHFAWNQVPSQHEQHLVDNNQWIFPSWKMTTDLHCRIFYQNRVHLQYRCTIYIASILIWKWTEWWNWACKMFVGHSHFHAELRAARFWTGRSRCLRLFPPSTSSASVREC